MTLLAALLAAASAAAQPAKGRVSFQQHTPYSWQERALIERTVRQLCPALLADPGSQVVETETAVNKSRIDQNYYDYFFTSRFSFATQEAPRITGTMVLKGERTSTSELSGIGLTVDPSWVCAGKS